MLNLGEKLTDDEVTQMIVDADDDSDGKISYDGYIIIVLRHIIILLRH